MEHAHAELINTMHVPLARVEMEEIARMVSIDIRVRVLQGTLEVIVVSTSLNALLANAKIEEIARIA